MVPMTSTQSAESAAVDARRPSGWAWLLVGVVGLMVAALGVLGVVVSFESVEAALEPSFGDSAWKVPVGVDLGIGVVTVLELLMTWLDVRARPPLAAAWSRGSSPASRST